jgi:hypothetical protein
MVWATVEEARSGGDHGSHIRALEDTAARQGGIGEGDGYALVMILYIYIIPGWWFGF